MPEISEQSRTPHRERENRQRIGRNIGKFPNLARRSPVFVTISASADHKRSHPGSPLRESSLTPHRIAKRIFSDFSALLTLAEAYQGVACSIKRPSNVMAFGKRHRPELSSTGQSSSPPRALGLEIDRSYGADRFVHRIGEFRPAQTLDQSPCVGTTHIPHWRPRLDRRCHAVRSTHRAGRFSAQIVLATRRPTQDKACGPSELELLRRVARGPQSVPRAVRRPHRDRPRPTDRPRPH